jgi:hypothetical protein
MVCGMSREVLLFLIDEVLCRDGLSLIYFTSPG